MKRLFFALFASLALLVVSLPAAPPYYPIDQIKPGMVATGHTVWQGDKIEEFKVHIIGVLRNVIGPRRDLILAKLEGGPLAQTGVIAGMSGSPVYLDGKLVGAVSYSLGAFSKEPIAGITPITEMIDAATLDTPRPPMGTRARLETACDARERRRRHARLDVVGPSVCRPPGRRPDFRRRRQRPDRDDASPDRDAAQPRWILAGRCRDAWRVVPRLRLSAGRRRSSCRTGVLDETARRFAQVRRWASTS